MLVYGNYIDEALLMKTPSQTYYYAHDQLYSPVVLVDAAGTPQERYEYDAYGSASIYEGTFSSTRAQPLASIGNPYLFTGREVDYLDNGSRPLQYNRHRYYSQSLGRWASEDPLGTDPAGKLLNNPYLVYYQHADGLSLYQYVANRATIYGDPFGLSCEDLCSPAGRNAYEFLNFRVTRGRHPNHDDMLDLAKMFGRGAGAADYLGLLVDVASHAPPNLIDFIYNQCYGGVACDNAIKNIVKVRDYIESQGVFWSWIQVQRHTCKSDRCGWRCKRLNWKKNGRPEWKMCTVGSQALSGAYESAESAISNGAACWADFLEHP